MHLRAITVENYRCFREPLRLELRPLTLLYGWNNAGKSTAARLVEVLGTSIEERARAPLESRARLGYRNLVWRPAESKPGALRFGLEWHDPADLARRDRATWRLDLDREADSMYIRELELRGASWDLHLDAARVQGPDHYTSRTEDARVPLHVEFRGLLPHSEDPRLITLHERLKALRGRCTWLRGDRITPPEMIPIDTPLPRDLGDRGEGAAELLLHPVNRRLMATVREWYAREEISRKLQANEVQRRFRQLLLNPKGASFDIPLIDTGAGMSQVLPVLTAIAAAKERVADNRASQELLAIEEPESQLHPNAQRALGEWICQIISADPTPQLVLETHSRVLILAVQLAIAQGKIDPQRVGVYWLDQGEDGATSASEVTFDAFGRPNNQWPREVFADDLELAELLTEAQIEGGAWDR